MKEYHKINSIFKRTERGQILEGDYSVPEFEYLKDNEWVWTEKVDGTNIRVIFNGENISFKGKTDNAQMPMFLLDKLNSIFLPKIDIFKSLFPEGVCLYGEGFGAKIQKGGNYIRNGVDFILFDIKINNFWLERKNIEDIAERLSIKIVPIVLICSISEIVDYVKKGFTSSISENTNYIAEGVVGVPLVRLFDTRGNRVITKIKYRDFND